MLQCIRLAVRGSRRWGSPLNCSSATFATGNQPHTIDDGGSRRPLPILLILGRPNVGKSTLFNRLAGKRAALVYDTPGSHVTRDYKEGEGRLSDLSFNIVDTSGLEPSMTSDSIQGRATRLTQQVRCSDPAYNGVGSRKPPYLPRCMFSVHHALESHHPVFETANLA